jgi:hypothetical protein
LDSNNTHTSHVERPVAPFVPVAVGVMLCAIYLYENGGTFRVHEQEIPTLGGAWIDGRTEGGEFYLRDE